MNAQDTNVTIHYNRIQKIREILTKQSITGENRENTQDTIVIICYRRKQGMREIRT